MGLAKNRTHMIGRYDIRHVLWWEACGSRNTTVTSDFRPKLEIRPFRRSRMRDEKYAI